MSDHLDALVAVAVALAVALIASVASRRRVAAEADRVATALATARAILDNASEAIIATGPDGVTITEWNPAAERLFGWSAAEVVGKALPTVGSDDAGRLRREVLTRVEQGEQVEDTARRTRRDGTEIDVCIAYSGLRDAQGRLTGWMGIVRDVTAERRQEERAVLVERLNAVIGDLIAERDLDDLLNLIVRSARELVSGDAAGLTVVEETAPRLVAVDGLRPELVGAVVSEERQGALHHVLENRDPVVVGDIGPSVMSSTGVTLHTIASVPSIVRGRVWGGLYVLWEEAGRPATSDELEILSLLAGHAGVALENASAFQRVVAAMEREEAVIAAIGDGLAVVDADGNVISWNPAAEKITGIPTADALGHPLPFDHDDDGEASERQMPDGRWIEAVASHVPGTLERVVDFRDVTASKELEDAKNLFVAMTGHELKTPLTVISGFAATLLHRWDQLSEDRRKEALEAIVRRSESLRSLIEQLLLVSRAEAGSLKISAQPLDLVPVLRLAAAGFNDLTEGHHLELDIPPSLPKVVADATAVDTVVAQLLENAFKYSPDGGTVRVSAHGTGDTVAVRVSDEGIGLLEEETTRIFDRFYQADGSDTRRFGGVGLGLYIVRRLVEAQGGEVTATGVPGEGSTFTFTLPCAP